MNCRAYLRFLFCSMFLHIPLVEADSNELMVEIPAHLQTACKGLDKKIAVQKEILTATIEKIVTNQTTSQFLNEINSAHETLQSEAAYVKAKALQDSLRLLDELKTYHSHLIHPHLLQKIDRSLRLAPIQEHDILLSLLRKERIHLLEMNDEYILLQTFCRHIKTIEMELTQALLEAKEHLSLAPKILELHQCHTTYLQDSNVQILHQTCVTLWSLFLDRESKLLKQVGYKDHLHSIARTTTPTYTCSPDLKEILHIEQLYYLQPLTSLEFTTLCLFLPFE